MLCTLFLISYQISINQIKIKIMFIYSIEIDYCGYDTYSGHIIVAKNEDEVRLLAKSSAADEGSLVWETAKITTEGNYTGENNSPFILLSSFHAV
jgi:hypothetical protein